MKVLISIILACYCSLSLYAQKINDSTTPLHLMAPNYDTPYGKPEVKSITVVLDRIYSYLDQTTPMALIDKVSNVELTDYSRIDVNSIFKPGDFRLLSYEWGVTYAGMLLATQATGDPKYATYTKNRLRFLADVSKGFLKFEEKQPGVRHAMSRTMHPQALDDCGAICAAMIKTQLQGFDGNLKPLIQIHIDYISNKEFRFPDGTLARNRPQPNSLWLDDLFMSVPALAQMGKYTGEKKYFDDAVKQVLQFYDRMFNKEKGLFMHGWILGMNEHPQFHWARANGWAVMTMVELLEVLPENHEGRAKVLEILRRHIRGLANYQSSKGFWHQLIDRNDSYLETSATAIYTYSIARAINRGYIDPKVYGPMVCLGWNAVASKVNDLGQVEGTCVGTGMGFDPAFYYYRPINVYAAHGYGPVLLAGAEMIEMVKKHKIEINDSAVQLSVAQTLPSRNEIMDKMVLANAYFMNKWPDTGKSIVTNRERPSNIWTRAVYYEGLMALHSLNPDKAYYDYSVSWGEAHKWGLRDGIKTRNADNQCCGQTYLDLYEMDKKPERIKDIQASVELMLNSDRINDWNWIDALQMGMPVFAKLQKITGDNKYSERMFQMYHDCKITQGLYNKKDKLWWRDKDFLPPYNEPNGEDCYWSRGNGWVVAALVRVMEILPNDPHYKEYKKTYLEMMKALLPIQREDGFWNVSLHDPNNFGGKETTGTALFVYGMAWGVNHGMLSAKKYMPAIIKGWNAMANEAVHPGGFLGYTQGTGKQPSDSQPVSYTSMPDFEDYGLGCFLLAGSEVYRLK